MKKISWDDLEAKKELIISALLVLLGSILLLSRSGHDLLLKIVVAIIGVVVFIYGFFTIGPVFGGFFALAVFSVALEAFELILVPLAVICYAIGVPLFLRFLFENIYRDKPVQRQAVLKVFAFLRGFLKFLAVTAAAAMLVILVWHVVMLFREKKIMTAPGEVIELNSYDEMCIHVEGEGEHTIVFLSGSGTAEPILDFKALCSELYGDCRIVVIERMGYGFSSKYVYKNVKRTAENIIVECRKLLEKAGIEGPFILCPHSMAGLYAIRWAQKYPDDVEAMIGLDMCVPATYEDFDVKGTQRRIRFGAVGRILGISRLFYLDRFLPDSLTAEEKALYRAVASRMLCNDTVRDEVGCIPTDLEQIAKNELPSIPTLMFCSDGTDTGFDNWTETQQEYASSVESAEIIGLDCGHYMHNEQPELIAERIRVFISALDD